MIDTRLKGRVVLVTGANNPCGIGAATARAFAAEGAKVFLTYLRRSPEEHGIDEEQIRGASTPGLPFYLAMQMRPADDLVQEIRENGGDAEAWEAGLADPANIPRLFDRAEAAFGSVDVLVNNASHSQEPDTIMTTSAETLDRYFAVNTRGTVLMMREFIRRHEQANRKWGRIISLSQDCAQSAGNHLAYSSSKATVEMLTRAVVKSAGPMGITVNAVAPGPTQTGCIAPEDEEKEAAELPLGRIGRPEDIASVIVFLASEQASWITGQVIKVDGGHCFAFK